MNVTDKTFTVLFFNIKFLLNYVLIHLDNNLQEDSCSSPITHPYQSCLLCLLSNSLSDSEMHAGKMLCITAPPPVITP